VLSRAQARRVAQLEQWQLRRVVRAPVDAVVEGWVRDGLGDLRAVCGREGARPVLLGCPFGAVDDWLWVRERWQVEGARAQRRIVYEADAAAEVVIGRQWLSPLLLPRKASRLWLRVYDVRCQRLQDACARDYAAEGVSCPAHDTEYSSCIAECPARRAAFAKAWNAAHEAPEQWERNPWVWAVSFTRFDVAGYLRAVSEADRSVAPSAPRRPRRNAQGRRVAARKV
jgi:hypothetical protein